MLYSVAMKATNLNMLVTRRTVGLKMTVVWRHVPCNVVLEALTASVIRVMCVGRRVTCLGLCVADGSVGIRVERASNLRMKFRVTSLLRFG